MAGISVLYTHTQELYPTLARGNAAGFLTGVGFLTAIITPIIFSLINTHFGINWSIAFISFSDVMSAFFVVLLMETKPIEAVEESILMESNG